MCVSITRVQGSYSECVCVCQRCGRVFFRCVPVGARLLKQHIVINRQVRLVVLRPSLQSAHIYHRLPAWIYNATPSLTG